MSSRDLLPRRERGRRLGWRRDHADQLGSKAAKRCLLAVPGKAPTVTTGVDGSQNVSGVATCGQVGFCPWCAPLVRANRGLDIGALVEASEWSGHELWFATFTLEHSVDQALEDVRRQFNDVWRGFVKDRWRAQYRRSAGVVGYVRAFELTRGVNGWHWHCHVLIVARPGFDPSSVWEGWRQVVETVGLRYVPRVTCDIRRAGSRHQRRSGRVALAAAEYLAKTGMVWGASAELARSDLKSGKSLDVGQLLDLASCGLPDEVELWAEYERSAKGTRWIEWSRGLRDLAAGWQAEMDRLGVEREGVWLGDVELTDEEASKGVVRSALAHRVRVRAECWNLAVMQGRIGEFLDDIRCGQWEHLGVELVVLEGESPPRLYSAA